MMNVGNVKELRDTKKRHMQNQIIDYLEKYDRIVWLIGWVKMWRTLGWIEAKAASPSVASTIGPSSSPPPTREISQDLCTSWIFPRNSETCPDLWRFWPIWQERDESWLGLGHPDRHRHRPRHRRPCSPFLFTRLVRPDSSSLYYHAPP